MSHQMAPQVETGGEEQHPVARHQFELVDVVSSPATLYTLQWINIDPGR